MAEKLVHLGVGNFHRAHQAWYTHRANIATGSDWRIIGVSLRRPDMRDALRPQAWRYTLAISDADGTEYEPIDIFERILVAPQDPGAVIAAIADPEVAIITTTVTEKGYHLEPATNRLNVDDPAIKGDLASDLPRTAIGYLAAGFAARKAGAGGPATVLCSDNLPDNGRVLQAALHAYCERKYPGLANWLATNVSFPNAMVDRITPATTEALREAVASTTGRRDAWPVATERFSQWVIEDRFAGPRPAWERGGAEIVADVAPYEIRKLRMLNGAHSSLAYLGVLAGHEYVHEAIGDPRLAVDIRAVMDEAAETIPQSVADSAAAYADQLMERFANPGLRHALRQIAMDGSQKIPMRILNSLIARLETGAESPALVRGLAGWLAFVIIENRQGRLVDDRLGDRLAEICLDAQLASSAAETILTERQIFGTFATDWPDAARAIVDTATDLVANAAP